MPISRGRTNPINMSGRAQVLDAAKAAVTQDRQASYGPPEESFERIARLWSAYLGWTLQPSDVALMMALLKVARVQGNPAHRDNYVDLAGYAACGAEIAQAAELREALRMIERETEGDTGEQ